MQLYIHFKFINLCLENHQILDLRRSIWGLRSCAKSFRVYAQLAQSLWSMWKEELSFAQLAHARKGQNTFKENVQKN
jgi:hypothetical protein